MLKAIKIRLYPNDLQSQQFHELLGCYRFVYNSVLDRKITKYSIDKKSENLSSLGKYFHGELLKNEGYKWLNKQNTKVLKQSIIDMLSAYKRFFEVKGTGFPRFKSKKDNNKSCRFPLEAISKRNEYSSGKLTLANFKNVKFKCSKKYQSQLVKYKDGIRSATLSYTPSGKFFLSILIQTDECLIKDMLNNSIGIDLGIKDFIVTSDGQTFDNLYLNKKYKKTITKLQRSISNKVIGSNNRNKARIKLAKAHEKVRNIKVNYLHNITNQLINENQVISIENLNVSGMLKNHKLANAIQNLSIFEFTRILKYKAEWSHRRIITIDRFFPSSKTCFKCKTINNKLKLSDREWTCTNCNTLLHRDLNAAQNINFEGLRLLSID